MTKRIEIKAKPARDQRLSETTVADDPFNQGFAVGCHASAWLWGLLWWIVKPGIEIGVRIVGAIVGVVWFGLFVGGLVALVGHLVERYNK